MRVWALVALFVFSTQTAWAACRDDVATLRGEFGKARFSIELADTPRERAQGLMFRETMPQSAGMLFVYPRPQRAAFWMKNTLIPLDMIFMDARGVVTHIHHRAVPGDLTSVLGGTGCFWCLRSTAGWQSAWGSRPARSFSMVRSRKCRRLGPATEISLFIW